MPRSKHLLLVFLVITCAVKAGSGQSRPVILIYSQGFVGYGEALAEMIEGDGRFDAEAVVVSQADLFRNLLYFPYVKAAVSVFNHDSDEGLGPDLVTYFEEGGGIVGLGFAGWWTTTRNASMDVFGLAANVYVSGRYERSLGSFTHELVVDGETEINSGIGDITVRTQRIIMRSNKSTGELMEPPEEGITVLYRDAARGYPIVFVREGKGSCVTFGGFTGDDAEDTPTYHGHLTSQPEFRELFTNAVYHVWQNENRFDATVASAEQRFAETGTKLEEVRRDAEQSEKRSRNLRMARYAIAIGLASLTCGLVYVYSFRRTDEVTEVG